MNYDWHAGWVYLGFIGTAITCLIWAASLAHWAVYGNKTAKTLTIAIPTVWIILGYLVAIGVIR